MPAPQTGHVSINGQDYRITLPSYRVTDIVDFAPRAATPGGSILHSELGLYQPLMLTDWRHGFGFQWFSDAMGYMRTEGNVDTRHAGVAMLFTNRASSDTNNAVKEGFLNFNGDWYGYGAALRKFSGGSWADSGSYGAVRHVMQTASYLFVARDNARLRKIDTTGTHTDAGANTDATDFNFLIVFNGMIYASVDGTNRIHYSDKIDASDLEGSHSGGSLTADTVANPDPDPDVIRVGNGAFPIIGMCVFAGKLYVFRHDGMWMIEDKLAKKVLDYAEQASSTNFRSWAVHNGMLVFPIRDRVKQWNGVRLADITPAQISDQFPYRTYGRFDNFVVIDSFLYCTARTSDASYQEDLLCYDGVGWHRLCSLLDTAGTGTVTAMGYDVVNNRMWYHLDTTSDVTYFIRLQDLSPFPYSDFPTTGTHSLISSRLDMGFRRVTKSSPSFLVEASNVTANRYLAIYYALDGGSWTLLGNVTANGVTTLTISPTIQYRYLQLRVDFITDSTTQTPVLEGTTIRFLMRPDTAYGYNFEIIGASRADFAGIPDDRTAKEIIDDLRTARASKAPITFVDIHGISHSVYVSQIIEQAVEMHLEVERDVPDVEFSIRVNLVEVG